jgi:hypothetical protein
MMDEQERRETNEAEMDEQEKQEVEEAERLYAEAEKQHTEAEERYREAEKQHTAAVSAAKQSGATRREEVEQRLADEAAEQQASEAAEQFADAVRASYQVMADRAVSAQGASAGLAQQFFNSIIDNLHTQLVDTRETTQRLAEQARKGQEATQVLTQESIGVYMDFMNSMFSYYQEGVGAAARGTREAERSTRGN